MIGRFEKRVLGVSLCFMFVKRFDKNSLST